MSLPFDLFQFTDIPTIDLHEAASVADAMDMLEHGLYQYAKEQIPACRIVHGIGAGIVKHHVHDALKGHPLIERFEEASDGGSTIVLF